MSGNILQLKASFAAYTITLASLATSSTLVAGRQSTAVQNSSEYLDCQISGKIRVGTSPTGGVIEIWAGAPINGTPTYPDTFGASDAAVTVTSANVRDALLRRVWVAYCDTTSDRDYPIVPVSLAQFFGGVLPERHFIWVTHSSGVNLNSTGGNHEINYRFFGARYT